MPSKQIYLISKYSSNPSAAPSLPIPDSLIPPNGATSVEITPTLLPLSFHTLKLLQLSDSPYIFTKKAIFKP